MLLITCLLSACGSPQASGKKTTSLRIWYETDDPVERIWSQQLVKRFQASHPHIQVKMVDYDFEDLNTKLQLALSSGHPPDLAYVTPRGPGIPVYVGAHQLLDLSQYAHTYSWASKLQPGLLADYNRPFAFYGSKQGSVVAVPTALAAVGVMYNRRLMAKLHLTVPDTLAAFQADLARAKAAGYTPLGIGNEDGWLGDDWYLTLVNALVPPSSLQSEQVLSKQFTFLRSPFVRAAATLQQWANKGYLTPNFGGLDAQEGIDLFFRGKTLFQLISSSEGSQIRQDEQQAQLPIGVFAFPSESGGHVMPLSGYLGWVIPRAAQHPKAAAEFIDSMLSPDIARLILSHGELPSHAHVTTSAASDGAQAATWLQEYTRALDTAQPGVYLDAAPIANMNATMEANVQLLLGGYESPQFLPKSLQKVYASHGKGGSTARIDGEF